MSGNRTLAREWLDRIEATGRGLTPWEQDFVASLNEQMEEKRTPTERQMEILERIYADRTPL